MKLISWNVNGLRAAVKHGFMTTFKQLDADFFCVQETKLQAGQIDLATPDYEQYWNYADRKGYSGTAIFTKHTPLQVTYGIGNPEHDTEGRVITLEYADYYLITCYTPNSGTGLKRLAYRQTWDTAFSAYLNRLNALKPIILCGDLNVAHENIDLKNWRTNHESAGFTDAERQAFHNLLASGYTDTFRYFYPDQTDQYSWWSYRFHARDTNAGWRIDYFITANQLADRLINARILTQVFGSDHCPVELTVRLSPNP
ncbi:exodeoxyribonuclease III [Lactobacillus sp. CBA3606]|uniref:exodeoxyribonuclease III n=1 Tax=Lactobacillus sp. CBA3606 TaxID=2099789 RepID=UPI000CFB6E9F|nr:exodeoxyribonuclease III [Lactobacillus sp. CBA3606]AVK64576.1 exodeoxyribonuclease III [Lactobacillus sp. CBA3606]